MKNKLKDIVLGSLLADTFTLGAHWIYSPSEIENAKLDWKGLNKPLAKWHEGKNKGDFTHYGDQVVCLYEYIKDEKSFDIKKYMHRWQIFMQSYTGYIDGASSDTLKNLQNNKIIPSGSNSHDLSVVARIAPLLFLSANEKTFLKNVHSFVAATHNNEEVLEAASFFASLLWKIKEGNSIIHSIEDISKEYSKRLQGYVQEGLNNSNNTIDAINEFGSACATDGAFQSTIYLLKKYDNDFENLMIQNVKAGGDSSVRAMIFTMMLIASKGIDILPKTWLTQMNYKI
ncbi:MAG: ADP-ribosylglycohydrolase family protein [Campylobacteraceae bacterium]|nr:ADP-ribosylglycohydrolase family protein [Campylobacteraceae bacterium]